MLTTRWIVNLCDIVLDALGVTCLASLLCIALLCVGYHGNSPILLKYDWITHDTCSGPVGGH